MNKRLSDGNSLSNYLELPETVKDIMYIRYFSWVLIAVNDSYCGDKQTVSSDGGKP